ncbi:hypothetical protein [Nonomuraea insulae]|uniref:Uncharacterized protein n=1 Tax=Nonomuraea insulae TaxID=1616787 RepID=A0ABW1CNT9_9ACTN
MPLNPSPSTPREIEIERARLREIRSRLPGAARPLDDVLPRLAALTVPDLTWRS